MRLEKTREYLSSKGFQYEYTEEDNCGSIDFEYRGIFYHIWEFPPEERGAESNVRGGGRHEEFYGDYEDEIIDIMKEWK